MGKLAANTKDIDLGEEADELRIKSVVAEVVLLAGARARPRSPLPSAPSGRALQEARGPPAAALAVGLAAPAAAPSPGAVAESRQHGGSKRWGEKDQRERREGACVVEDKGRRESVELSHEQ